MSFRALAWPCGNPLTEDYLIIRSGLLREEVRLAGIRQVERSSALGSAPAFSLWRVRIAADAGVHLISPRDRDGFIAELTARLGRGGASAGQAAPR